MIRLCQKRYCENESIPRGKYCNLHRTNKKKQTIIQIKNENNYLQEEDNNKKEINKKIEEDRLIIKQQKDEYIETERIDRENMDKIQFLKVIEESKKLFIKEKRESLEKEPEKEKDVYSFKIKLPNGKMLLRRFKKYSKINDIRDYLEVYFYDNNISIINYNLVLNYPTIKFENTKDVNDLKLINSIYTKNTILYIENLDE